MEPKTERERELALREPLVLAIPRTMRQRQRASYKPLSAFPHLAYTQELVVCKLAQGLVAIALDLPIPAHHKYHTLLNAEMLV